MAMVKLRPHLQHYLWGGRKLVEKYNVTSEDKVAESWVVSCHKDGPSIVVDGPFANMTLLDYINRDRTRILGTRGAKYESFPILIKLLDAKQDLSIQVHPDNEYALRVEKEYGKNEMWLVLEQEEHAGIYYGVKDTMTKEEFRSAIEDNTIVDKLNKVETKPYDFFYVPAGTIHALGAGNVIAEIQQSSNSTYRIYDFDRKDANGNKRELHIDKALDVSNLEPMTWQPTRIHETKTELLNNEYFKVNLYKINQLLKLNSTDESFQALLVTKGSGSITMDDVTYQLKQGEAVFIDADSQYCVDGQMEVVIAEV